MTTATPTLRTTGSAAPMASATVAPRTSSPQCVDDAQFHAKDCPQCTCAWFAQDPMHCRTYGQAQGVTKDPVTGRWYKAATACCACHGGAQPVTDSPTSALFAPVPAVAASDPRMVGCTDKRGEDAQRTVRAFFLKGCEACDCQWLAHDDRCEKYARYTGAIRADGAVMRPKDACCVCGGGHR